MFFAPVSTKLAFNRLKPFNPTIRCTQQIFNLGEKGFTQEELKLLTHLNTLVGSNREITEENTLFFSHAGFPDAFPACLRQLIAPPTEPR
jgi:hypothetical protein